MTVLETAKKMIDYSHGNLHDINHFMKVYAYAKMIADGEQLDPDTQKLVEMTALVHDIACPLCRVKYGNTNGKNQEKESAALIAEFFKDSNLPQDFTDRISFLVSHHHTLDQIDGIDYQIIIEADYLVNADESHFSGHNIKICTIRYLKQKPENFCSVLCIRTVWRMKHYNFQSTEMGDST